jgi:hypothetical protein
MSGSRPTTKRTAASRGLAVAAIASAALAIASTPAAATVDTSMCSNPLLTQPFLAWGDHNWYALVPGQSPDSFAGTGWTLSGGATITTTNLYDGTTGPVLNLPSGSKAVSPVFCVTSSYPTARMMVRDVKGSEGVFFYVSYEGTSTWNTPKNTGQVHGQNTAWTLATPVNLQPYNVSGWQPMRITLIPGGTTSDFQIYNLYDDPYSKGG